MAIRTIAGVVDVFIVKPLQIKIYLMLLRRRSGLQARFLSFMSCFNHVCRHIIWPFSGSYSKGQPSETHKLSSVL